MRDELVKLVFELHAAKIDPKACTLNFKRREDLVAAVGVLQKEMGTTIPIEDNSVRFSDLWLKSTEKV